MIDVSFCRCRANAAGGARNDGDFAFKTLIHPRYLLNQSKKVPAELSRHFPR
jgi:hypothetical protein